MDFQNDFEIKENNRFYNQLQTNFKNFKENKARNEKIEARKRKEEEFLAAKEAKLKLEMEVRQKALDDLERERIKFIKKQEEIKNKKEQEKQEKLQERESFIEFMDVVKYQMVQEKTREEKEREFEYAQELSAKWLRLHSYEQQVKEKIQIAEKLVSK